MKRFLPLLLSAAAVGLTCLTGCSDIELREATSKYDVTMQTSIKAIRDYYSELNGNYRKGAYVATRFDPGATFQVSSVSSTDYLLGKDKIDPKYISARLEVLTQLTDYSKGLGMLATSDAPKQVGDELVKIGNTSKSISSHIAELNNNAASTTLANINAYTGFVTQIAGIVMPEILNMKKDAAIKKYIEKGSKPANDAYDLLEQDLGNIYTAYVANQKSLLATKVNHFNHYLSVPKPALGDFTANGKPLEQAEKELAAATAAYENTKAQFPFDRNRQALLEELQEADKNFSTISQGNPVKLIAELKQAQANLENAANGKKTSAEIIARLMRDLDTILDDADRISKAIKALKEETKKGDE